MDSIIGPTRIATEHREDREDENRLKFMMKGIASDYIDFDMYDYDRSEHLPFGGFN